MIHYRYSTVPVHTVRTPQVPFTVQYCTGTCADTCTYTVRDMHGISSVILSYLISLYSTVLYRTEATVQYERAGRIGGLFLLICACERSQESTDTISRQQGQRCCVHPPIASPPAAAATGEGGRSTQINRPQKLERPTSACPKSTPTARDTPTPSRTRAASYKQADRVQKRRGLLGSNASHFKCKAAFMCARREGGSWGRRGRRCGGRGVERESVRAEEIYFFFEAVTLNLNSMISPSLTT